MEELTDVFEYRDADDDTYLHLCIVQKPEAAMLLIQNERCKENLDVQNKLGQTALHLAVIQGLQDVVEALLDSGAQQKGTISGDGDTAMHLAAKLGKNKCLQILCQSADEETLQIQNEAGDTALHKAIFEKNFKAAEIIIGKQTDVNAKNMKTGETALHYAVEKDNIEIVEKLLDAGAEVNAKSFNGNTPLHWVTDKDQREMAEVLLRKGADVYIENDDGKSPIKQADKTLARFLQRNRLDRKTRRKRTKGEKPDQNIASQMKGCTIESNSSTGATAFNYLGKKPKQIGNGHDDDDDGAAVSFSFDGSETGSRDSNSFQPESFLRMLGEVSPSSSNASQSGSAAGRDSFQFPEQAIPAQIDTGKLPYTTPQGLYHPALGHQNEPINSKTDYIYNQPGEGPSGMSGLMGLVLPANQMVSQQQQQLQQQQLPAYGNFGVFTTSQPTTNNIDTGTLSPEQLQNIKATAQSLIAQINGNIPQPKEN